MKFIESDFKMNVNHEEYELEIRGVGPVALKVSIFIKYHEIDKAEKNIEKTLTEYISEKYPKIINDNTSYQEKLKKLQEESDKYEAEQEKIREEVRLEQEEKERKRKELEEMLNRDKPKFEKPFKF